MIEELHKVEDKSKQVLEPETGNPIEDIIEYSEVVVVDYRGFAK